jgi:hypothetical protein
VPTALAEHAGLIARHALRVARTPLAAIRPRLTPRRFHAFGIGAPKTGTHSLAGLFSRYRAAHEPEHELLIPFVLRQGPAPAPDAAALLRAHDRRLWLELESSHVLVHFVRTLVSEWPEARFVLTMRDCYGWLDSILNNRKSGRAPARWRALGEFRRRVLVPAHRRDLPRDASGQPRDLDATLAYWALHQRLVLDAVPAGRLLVVRTHELGGSAPAIARFLGIPAASLDLSRAHEFKTPGRTDKLGQIDRDVLEAAVDRYCGPLMRTYFPEMPDLDAARRVRRA